MTTLNKQSCPTCGQSVNEREIGLFMELIVALWEVCIWCKHRNNFEFTRMQVKHLLKTDSIIARFGDLVLFGGLVYRPDGKKGHYGINVQRARDFFAGKYSIPVRIIKNPLTGELKKEDYRFIEEIPQLKDFLDENMQYISRYKQSEQQNLNI